jgi:hypothetical protein
MIAAHASRLALRLALASLSVLCFSDRAAAQVVPDTARVDTAAVVLPADTVPPPETRPVVLFPRMPLAPAAGIAAGEWFWDRDALLREAATSLIELLERIPAVTTVRAGMFAQPEAAAAFGGTAARVEIEIDGYVIDPLADASLDLAHLPLVQIRELHVQRRLGLLRIRIVTEEPTADLPYTRVEAGIGQPPANLFRGLILAPHVVLGPLGLAVERLDTDGLARAEPASLFSGWAKWAWTDGQRGVQLEILRSTLEREPASPWTIDRVRQDATIRARQRLGPAFFAEVYVGRSTVTDSVPLPAGDTIIEPLTRYRSTQAGMRGVLQTGLGIVQARLRLRDGEFLPRLEAGLEADGRFGPVRAGAELAHATWRGAAATSYLGAHAEVGLPLGASAFGELTSGTRGAPPLRRGAAALPLVTERSGWRAGVAASVAGGRASGSIAAIGLAQDAAWPFGLPFDSLGAPGMTDDARGIEAYGRVVIVPGWLALESWITEWFDAAGWAYMPLRSWRTALELHALPLPSGNLELLGRLDAVQRGGLLAFAPDGAAGESPFVPVPSFIRINGYLQIRIIDVRIFLRWEDFMRQEIVDLPGRVHRGPRVLYGVKWNLWN